MVPLLIALALSGPPRATLEHVPLAVSSWCWGARCGAPIAASTGAVVVPRGATVHVALAFEPTGVQVAVAGKRVRVAYGVQGVSWRATLGGGVTIRAAGAGGWVTYVGRIRLKRG